MTPDDIRRENNAKTLLAQCALEELRSQFAVDFHPRHIELTPRSILCLPQPQWKIQFVLARRTDLQQRDWMRHTLSLAGRSFRLPARQWERAAGQIRRIASHFLRSESYVSDPPDVAAAVIDPMRYRWRVRVGGLKPVETIHEVQQWGKQDGVRLNNHVTIRTGDVHFATARETTTTRVDFRIMERRILSAEFDRSIYERVAFGAKSLAGPSFIATLLCHPKSPFGLQETPLVSFIRFLPNDGSFQAMRFSLGQDGKSLIYIRRAYGPNLYLALTEPYDLLDALGGLRSRGDYALL